MPRLRAEVIKMRCWAAAKMRGGDRDIGHARMCAVRVMSGLSSAYVRPAGEGRPHHAVNTPPSWLCRPRSKPVPAD